MNIIKTTAKFNEWLVNLADPKAKAKITIRAERAQQGNFGDSKSIGEGIYEMRIDYGPGYRVYYARQGDVTYLLLCGGDKSDQRTDIQTAKAIWTDIKT